MNRKQATEDSVDFYVFEEAVDALLRTHGRKVLVHAYASCAPVLPDVHPYVWIEGRGGVYVECQMGGGMLEDYDFAKNEWYKRLKIEKIRRYTIPQMMQAILKHQHFGPWEFDEYLDGSCPIQLEKSNVSEAAAIHEAAHAVCALHYWPDNGTIRYVVVSPSGQDVGQCLWSMPSDPSVSAAMSMAGVVAECLLLRNALSRSETESCEVFVSGDLARLRPWHDIADVSSAIEEIDLCENADKTEARKACMRELKQVVRRVSPQIRAVADALMRKPFLTGKEVYQLCGMHWR